MARNPELEVKVGADTTEATRAFDDLGGKVGDMADTFNTQFGNMGLHVRDFVSESAIQLGRAFATDIAGAILDVEALDRSIGLVFSADQQAAFQPWLDSLQTLTGEGELSMLGLLADDMEKFGLNSQDAKDVDMAKTMLDLAAAISNDLNIPLDEANVLVGNFVDKGEAGMLSDYYGEFDTTSTAVGNLNVLLGTDGIVAAFALADTAAGTARGKFNELRGDYEDAVNWFARVMIPVIAEDLPAAIGWARGEVGKLAADLVAPIAAVETLVRKLPGVPDSGSGEGGSAWWRAPAGAVANAAGSAAGGLESAMGITQYNPLEYANPLTALVPAATRLGVSTLSDLAPAVGDLFSPSGGSTGLTYPAGYQGGSPANYRVTNVNVTVPPTGDPAGFGQAAVERIADYERSGGG